MQVTWIDRRVTWAGAVGSALDGLVSLAGVAVVAAVMVALVLVGMLAEAATDACRRRSRKVPR